MSNISKEVKVKSPISIAVVFMFAAFIGLFGETSLNIALANIMSDLNVDEALVQWLTTGYLLTLGILVPVSALLIRWFTTRQLVLASLTLSIIGSAMSALAPEFYLLMSGRVIQALGTGLLLPLMMNVILIIFPIERRGTVMGFMGLVISAAPAFGPALAGLIIQVFSWHYLFWLSLVLFIIIFPFAMKYIENVTDITQPRIDVLSIILSTFGFGGLIYSLSNIAVKSIQNATVYIPLIIGVIAVIVFILRQLKLESPMLNIKVFKFPMFSLGVFHLFLGMILILAPSILLPLYLRGSLMYNSAITGLVMLPAGVITAVMSPIIGSVFDRIGPKLLIPIGFSISFIGALISTYTIRVDAALWEILMSIIIYAFGLALISMPSQTNGLNQLPKKSYSDGSAVMNTLQQIAGAIGTAGAITIMIQGQKMFMKNNTTSTSQEALASGTNFAFYFIAGIALIGLISSFFVKRVSITSTEKD